MEIITRTVHEITDDYLPSIIFKESDGKLTEPEEYIYQDSYIVDFVNNKYVICEFYENIEDITPLFKIYESFEEHDTLKECLKEAIDKFGTPGESFNNSGGKCRLIIPDSELFVTKNVKLTEEHIKDIKDFGYSYICRVF